MSSDPIGSDDEFEAFFREHYTDVHRFASTLVADGDIDDIVSTTFTTAWHEFHRVPTDAARGWLFGTARNMARNKWAMGRRRRSLIEMISDARPQLTARLAAGGFDPVEVAPFLEVLRELSDEDRELMIMVGWFEMTPHEVAQATGARPGNIRTRLHRMRRSLERDFRQRVEGGEVV